MDGRILLYCSASTLGVALVCGLLPAVRAMREDAGLASGESGRTQVSGRQRLQWALVGGQVALSVTLLGGRGAAGAQLPRSSRAWSRASRRAAC